MEGENINNITEWGDRDFFDVDAVSNLRRLVRKLGDTEVIKIIVDFSGMQHDEFVANARRIKAMKDESYKVVAIVKCTEEQKMWEINAFQSGVQTDVI